jgi:tetraacyldisaccharide 4'-kinase
VRELESIWSGDSLADHAARAALLPFETIFRGLVAARGAMYDRGILSVEKATIPVVSVGNLTVGGTGKTPVAAWIASRLSGAGKEPAIVLRGYGGDESIVHKALNPDVPVFVTPDRAAAISMAARSGARSVVMDDAFQHRRAARDVDIVLLSADDWTSSHRLLPAGPYREPLGALRRASVVFITRKTASEESVRIVEREVRRIAPAVIVGVIKLQIDELVSWQDKDKRFDLRVLDGTSVLGVAGVGNPGAFFDQLEQTGAKVTRLRFPDHQAYGRGDIDRLIDAASSHDYLVCTLKDAVKLGPQWPADAVPLWYVSLSVIVESGGAAIDEIISRLGSR